MSFVRFEHVRKGFDPKASLSVSGRLSFNEGAIRQYGLNKYRFVSLLYDDKTKTIGLEFYETEAIGSMFKLQFRKDSGFFVSVVSFLKYFNIFPESTGFYEIRQDEENKAFFKMDLKTKKARGEKSKQSK